MSVLWHKVITADIRQDANISLASFVLSPGEKGLLAAFYGTSVRTVNRWFADESEQRRPCIVEETEGLRLIFMTHDSRLEYLRNRAFLPFLFSVPGGIDRESGNDGETKFTFFTRPSLSSCIQIASLVVDGLSDGEEWIRKAWENMQILETGVGNQKWTLQIRYRRPGVNQDYNGEEEDPDLTEDEGEEKDNDPRDSESQQAFEWEPQ